MATKPEFLAGRNIAMKVPPHQYEATIAFYREILGFKEKERLASSVVFEFGVNDLWIDSVPCISQAEIWLEVLTSDIAAASDHLKNAGIVRCDEIESLPEGVHAFWVSSPSSIIHLVGKDSES
jgi:hypothetical protein